MLRAVGALRDALRTAQSQPGFPAALIFRSLKANVYEASRPFLAELAALHNLNTSQPGCEINSVKFLL